ncbi:glycosyltransferase family 4 protein [Trinickia violacea]|uniref:Glycosyltransferase family 4 protein n=1 Tax=Trinickia violacea TaxID=2571746 RepID=A0A4P8IR74_9BURK|nr:glycosyltransferase family 4 protein [Trinickia violacea]QCP50856.1 glycosyltransferase family 4 protein [Trinickia violacea]
MRILHLVLAPRLSGAEVLAKDLAIHHRRQGNPVCVTSLTPEHEDFQSLRRDLQENGVPCRFPRKAHGLVGRLWHLYHVIRHEKPDVIFAHATIPAFYARALPIGAPIVYVMHSATNDFERHLFRSVERILSPRARAVIGVSQANVEDYIAAVGPHPLMTVIPNGVDMARFASQANDNDVIRAPRIVQIGRYTSVKNQLQTVHAFGEVVREVSGAKLLLFGVIEDPAYHAAVIDLVNKLGLTDRVIVDGPRADVSKVLFDASVFAMPSRSEGHSIAFLEALASGIPVVGSAIAPFAFAKDFPNVQLLDTNNTTAYAGALVTALGQRRAERTLTGLTLQDSAERYLAVARQVTHAGSAS